MKEKTKELEEIRNTVYVMQLLWAIGIGMTLFIIVWKIFL